MGARPLCPSGWFFTEVVDLEPYATYESWVEAKADDSKINILFVCSEACRDACWTRGPAPKKTAPPLDLEQTCDAYENGNANAIELASAMKTAGLPDSLIRTMMDMHDRLIGKSPRL